ncbi:hypothetical protein GCM10022244_14090 [Streptomyces gulbargensis]|uniref:Uncharacterized protein n=1 Tax=Streptomyces gulbargensis TaxID=364901 RepID=A0ABP7LMW3_9ACTN
MAHENHDRWAKGGNEEDPRQASTPPSDPGAPLDGAGPAPRGVPAQRTGHPEPSPPVPPPTALPRQRRPTVPFEDPGATGRNGGSDRNAPAATPAAPRGRDAAGGPDAGPARGESPAPDDGDRLFDEGTRDRLEQRLHHALVRFVDAPHESVAEADEVLAEAEEQLLASLRDRRAALRAGWREDGRAGGPNEDTERLRVLLRTYREVTRRLLGA